MNVQEVQNDGSVLSHDPLPPVDSIDIYKIPRNTTRTSSNLLSLFVSSLFTDTNEVSVALFYENLEQM